VSDADTCFRWFVWEKDPYNNLAVGQGAGGGTHKEGDPTKGPPPSLLRADEFQPRGMVARTVNEPSFTELPREVG
jgi:hypothetical protein